MNFVKVQKSDNLVMDIQNVKYDFGPDDLYYEVEVPDDFQFDPSIYQMQWFYDPQAQIFLRGAPIIDVSGLPMTNPMGSIYEMWVDETGNWQKTLVKG